jgi:hypothetical protein
MEDPMTLTKVLCTALLSGITLTGLACENPPLAQVPTGENLSERAERRVREEVAAYFAAMQTYTACLQAELAAAGGEEAPQLTKAALVVRNNGAVAEAEAVMRLFNDHIGPAAAEE